MSFKNVLHRIPNIWFNLFLYESVLTKFVYIKFDTVGPSGTGAGFGTGNSGLFGGASASGGGISSANNGGFGVGSGSGSSFGGGLFGQHATGTGSGFSFGK